MRKRNSSEELVGISGVSRKDGDREGLEKRGGATAMRREIRFSRITEVRGCLLDLGAGGGTDVEEEDESSTKKGGESERDN